MNAVPKISITVPALNEEENIGRLLKSFRNQTYQDFEVIIVDNGSTDSTKDIVNAEIKLSHYSLRLLIEEKKGVGFSRRKGMDDASSREIPFLAGTDADSIVPSDWIESIIKTFDATKADCLFGFATFDWDRLKVRPDVYALCHGAWIVRQSVAKSIDVPARGVNFAITSDMYRKVGGMPQPQGENSRPLPGEDIQLRKLVEMNKGKLAIIDSSVITSPRRVLRAILKDSPDDYYKDFEDVRGEDDLFKLALGLDIKVFERFVEATLKRIFLGYIVKNIDTALWDKAKIFVRPEAEFVKDSKILRPVELYGKYKESFVNNAKNLYSN